MCNNAIGERMWYCDRPAPDFTMFCCNTGCETKIIPASNEPIYGKAKRGWRIVTPSFYHMYLRSEWTNAFSTTKSVVEIIEEKKRKTGKRNKRNTAAPAKRRKRNKGSAGAPAKRRKRNKEGNTTASATDEIMNPAQLTLSLQKIQDRLNRTEQLLLDICTQIHDTLDN